MMNDKAGKVSLGALFIALVFVITRFIQIPIPFGYFNMGNSVILFGCLIFPSPYGILAGSIGSALADLTSYPIYTIPTLAIKFLMPFVFYKLQKMPVKRDHVKQMAAFAIATIIPLVGYTVVGGILYGAIAAGLAQLPGLILEYVANIVVFEVLYHSVYYVVKRNHLVMSK